ncbi:MAG: TrkA C-terminal domain-containing protein [Thermotogota bacterium]|jgi:trk system potassium uptake protein TrkA|nr:TrkA C-terminal domain-containing protein [Thermotogota bacterium]
MNRIFYIIEGKILAYSLAKKLLLLGNQVYYVSKNSENLEILDGLKVNFPSLELVKQDPTDIKWIENLDLNKKVEALIIISEDDALNFVVSWLLREYYEDIKIISLVNATENETIFKGINVETLVPISWMQKLIESSLIHEDITDFFNPYVEKLSILELTILEDDKAVNKKVKELKIPQNSIIGVLIREDGDIMVPQGETTIYKGDRLIVLALKEQANDVIETLKSR